MAQKRPPKRLYLIKAMLAWVQDCQDTPYLLVDAACPGVDVPMEHVQGNQIVLNIAPEAVQDLKIDRQGISCSARFSGVSRPLFVPMMAIVAMYGANTGEGLVFPSEPGLGDLSAPQLGAASTRATPLRVVK